MAAESGFSSSDNPPSSSRREPSQKDFVLPNQSSSWIGSSPNLNSPITSPESPYHTFNQAQAAPVLAPARLATSSGLTSDLGNMSASVPASSSRTAPIFDFTPPDILQSPSFTVTSDIRPLVPDTSTGTDLSHFESDPTFEGLKDRLADSSQSLGTSEPSTALTYKPREMNYPDLSVQSASLSGKTVSQWDLAVNSVKPTDIDEESTPWIGGLSYSRMTGESDAFRLLVLEPSTSRESKLDGWLFVSSLESHPVYETLSYVWGDLSTHEVITLRELKVTNTAQSNTAQSNTAQSNTAQSNTARKRNRWTGLKVANTSQSRKQWTGPAVDFKITYNLALALRQLRHPLVARVLWVDCICINQQDNDERSSQVQLMARIYKQGARSMIWLGADEDRHHEAVLQYLKELSKMPFSHVDEIKLQKRIVNEWESTHGTYHGNWRPDLGSYSEYKATQENLMLSWAKDFFENSPLWRRIWIMQEIVFAPHPFVLCGTRSLEWEALGHCLEQGSSNLSLVLRDSQSWKHARMINQRRNQLIRQAKIRVPKSDLLSLFLRCQTFRSTDPRDMLYALLNLTTENPGIKPNYNISSREMWIAFGKALMAHTKTLLLLYQEEIMLTVSERGLPSWISYSLNSTDFWFDKSSTPDAADFSIGYLPEDYYTPHTMLQYLPVMSVLLDTLEIDRTPDYPFYRLYPSEAHHGHWNSTEVDQNYENAKDLMQDCLKEFLPTHLGRVQTTSAGCKGTNKTDALAISGHRRLSKDEIHLYEQQWRNQKWDRLAVSDAVNGTGVISDRLRRLRFEITPKGFPVLLPPSAKKGDQLFVLFGSAVPIVLRPVGRFNDSRTYRVVGQAFVHGADRGQAVHPGHVRNELHLWAGPLVSGTEELPWEERKAAIHKARVEQWKQLQVDEPKLIFLD